MSIESLGTNLDDLEVQFEGMDLRTNEERELDSLDFSVETALQLSPDQTLHEWEVLPLMRVNDRTGRGIQSQVVVRGKVSGPGTVPLNKGDDFGLKEFVIDHTTCPREISEVQRDELGRRADALYKAEAAAEKERELRRFGRVVFAPEYDESWRPHRVLSSPRTEQSYWV